MGRWATMSLGLSAATLALAAALIGHDRLFTPAPGWVRLLFLVPTLVVLRIAWTPATRAPFVRAPWWQWFRYGYLALTAAMILRDHPHLLGTDPATPLVRVLGVTGAVALTISIGVLEAKRGRRDLLDLGLDIIMMSVAFLLTAWCTMIRPGLGAGRFHGVEALDALFVCCGLVLVAALVAAAVSGYLTESPTIWAAVATVIHISGNVVALQHASVIDPPLAATLLWSVSGLCLAEATLQVLRNGGPLGGRAETPRWRPVTAALACAVPLALYAVEAFTGDTPDEPPVPDAVAIGLTLLVLSVGCIIRVARSVGRAQAQRHQLADLARSDHLTGIANRRTAEEELRRAFARADIDDEVVSVALLDLDHFKGFNDRYGHHAGDELLIGCAQAWSGCLGTGQVLARYGGEEFLVIGAGTAPSGLAEVLDRMRRATPRAQTFSAGIAAWDGAEGVATLVARADVALYEAKETGRARTCVAYTSTTLGAGR